MPAFHHHGCLVSVLLAAGASAAATDQPVDPGYGAPTGPLGRSQVYTALAFVFRTDLDGRSQDNLPVDYGETIRFRYSAASGRYSMSIKDFDKGPLIRNPEAVYAFGYLVPGGDAHPEQDLRIHLNAPYWTKSSITLTYTGYGGWDGSNPAGQGRRHFNSGTFVYGVATPADTMPTTGVATYLGQLSGGMVVGDVLLAFDFGAGTFGGHLDPELIGDGETYPLGRYTIVRPLYETGDTHFSAGLFHPVARGASFLEGQFNGPGAPELMARFRAPYLSPWSGKKKVMHGTLVAVTSE